MTEGIIAALSKLFGRLNWYTVLFFVAILLAQGGFFYFFLTILLKQAFDLWWQEWLVASFTLIVAGILALYYVDRFKLSVGQAITSTVGDELVQLRAANHRAKSLRDMASILRATLSFERVVEQALDVSSIALEEMGIPRHALVGAVFLFDGNQLIPVAAKRFLPKDYEQNIRGKRGVVHAALSQAEIMVTENPGSDPELRTFSGFKNCLTAVCVPLRAGFNMFGIMVIGSDTAVQFNNEHFDLFNAVADQAVIALQNAQLYQSLEEEKLRLIEADEEARKELARDLHDGPTQSIAAIAMRLNFIRALMVKDPDRSMEELEKVEKLAKKTSKEIRGMLFTLRPLVIETQGLGPAIQTVMNRLKEAGGLEMRLVGGEHGNLLNETAQGVVFSIIEEAIGNARKHADAKVVEVRLWQEENLFVADIQDDGLGFDQQSVTQNYSSRGSLGLINMRERAERIDGSLSIESRPNEGTAVRLVVPLDKHGRRRNNNHGT
ncbi:MAG: GAF domain-containing sensor histidine kinase [Chloroflexota bacterium]